ncbi:MULTISPECIES: GntR family transcriptional regulator [Clostridium]|jgi:GntR family transcriptional regulator|uniref:GntR family transcriptional regulator n=2 Tax=root TaxID=1 RepID=R9BWG7_9CLOT|nr:MULTISPECIES: GntR family transcriptional regulator [Clostridium]EOR21397.1 GntR family transcriptional regulator [Clostridium sartagoforme AAU1]KLE17005.1 GntR family transcriptional regulator [Clostridium sp. C8]
MVLELSSKEPIYLQIIAYIKKKIVAGELKKGERILSVRDYASELKVNPNTIQKVYSELENENLIYTQRGIGKFVTEDEKKINELRQELFNETIDKFIEDSKALGFTKETILAIISSRYKEDKNE